MALTRAQLLAGNSSQGVVLPGQVRGVKQGIGVTISADGTISFDSTTALGVLKLNNTSAYNAYVWPTLAAAPDSGTIITTDGSGNITWTADYVATTGATGAALIPGGDDTERAAIATPTAGMLRYNDQGGTPVAMEYYDGAAWTQLSTGGGGGGGGGGGVASVAVTAPITNTGTATAPTIGISAATTAAAGSVELADSTEAAAGTDSTRAMTPATGVPKIPADMTGAALIPGGDDSERPGISATGMLRYNDQSGTPVAMEYYDGAAWTQLSTGGGGGGATWINEYVALPASVSHVAYGGGKFVAVGDSGTALLAITSTDGLTWTSPVTVVASSVTVQDFKFANGDFVVLTGPAAGPMQTYKSPDAITWTAGASVVTASTGTSYAFLAGGGGSWVFCSLVSGANEYIKAWYSSDGLNWTQSANNIGPGGSTGYKPRSLTFGGGDFVITNYFSKIYKSSDGGVSWSQSGTLATTSITQAASQPLNAVYDGTYFIFQGYGGSVQAERSLAGANASFLPLKSVSPIAVNGSTVYLRYNTGLAGAVVLPSSDSGSTASGYGRTWPSTTNQPPYAVSNGSGTMVGVYGTTAFVSYA